MRTDRTSPVNARTIVDAKMSLSLWLRAGRAHKGLSLEAVAKITKIQPRILERLEAGKLEGLPAEVFVRGFVRSYARCVGLDEAEALERYALAAAATTPGTTATATATASARALVDSMSELAPSTARSPKVLRREPEELQLATGSLPDMPAAPVETVVEVFLPETGTLIAEPPVPAPPLELAIVEQAAAAAAHAVDVAIAPEVVAAVIEAEVAAVEAVQLGIEAVAASAVEPAKKGGKKRKGGKGKKRKEIASGTPAEPTPVVEAAAPIESIALAEGSTATAIDLSTTDPSIDVTTDATVDATSIETVSIAEPEVTEPWAPKMPTIVAPSVPWRRPAGTMSSTAVGLVVPSLVIDDADPESAERELDDRAAAKEPARRSFLPPILLDREDRSARQGGLTLAVIILLIAATLTLSYLMRRPSSSGDGVTELDVTHQTLA